MEIASQMTREVAESLEESEAIQDLDYKVLHRWEQEDLSQELPKTPRTSTFLARFCPFFDRFGTVS